MKENEIVINEQAKEILTSFANIDSSIIIRNDYLFTKNGSLMGYYQLPEDEIIINGEVPIDDLKEFLDIEALLNEDKNIIKEEEAIVFKDSNKKFTLAPGYMKLMKQFNPAGLDLFKKSEDKVCEFILTELDIENIKKYRSVIKAKEIYVVAEDGIGYIELTNVDNENKSRVKLDGKVYEDDFRYQINDKRTEPFFDFIYTGKYKLSIKKAKVGDTDTLLILLSSIDIADTKDTGKLIYFTAKEI